MRHYNEMSSLLVEGKSHLFPQFVHLNRARGKVTADTSSGHWGPGERGEVTPYAVAIL